MTMPEFSRAVRIDTIGEQKRPMTIAADEGERVALARRFGLLAIARLEAALTLSRRGEEIIVEGVLAASVTQACVATAEPVAAGIEAPFEILFRPQPDAAAADDEVELSESEMDVVFHDGAEIDLGEAVAETLALALDPYPRAPDADEALKAAGVKNEAEAGPFGALAGLRDKLKGE
ncbi:MAG TPA: DUF177 domain-containing protein [Allosphingosinicella sp.]|jgi:uncharacterized metal-binding protein YceD (DUF177 family)|nr:DUF177 domain-containing protein [Allosphingosinicella sp.]